MHEGRSEDNWFKSVLSTHCAGRKEQIQTVKLVSKCLYLLSHVAILYFHTDETRSFVGWASLAQTHFVDND